MQSMISSFYYSLRSRRMFSNMLGTHFNNIQDTLLFRNSLEQNYTVGILLWFEEFYLTNFNWDWNEVHEFRLSVNFMSAA